MNRVIEQLRNNIHPGQIISARVMEKVSSNSYMIQLAGFMLPFTSRQRLDLHQKIILKVRGLNPQITLQFMGTIRDTGSLEASF